MILSKKRFCFHNPADRSEVFETAGGGAIQSAPEWIAADPFFALAVADGDVIEFESKTGDNEIEKKAAAKRTGKKNTAAKGSAAEK